MKYTVAIVAGALLMAAGSASVAVAAQTQAAAVSGKLAQCVYTKHQKAAVGLLGTSTADDAKRMFTRLANKQSCFEKLIGDSEFSPDALPSMAEMRGALAEYALRQSSATASTLPALAVQKTYDRPWFAATGRLRVVDEMAACVADTDPGGVSKVLGTTPGTFGEGAALSSLRPSLGKCLTAGAKIGADPVALRAALADALYQRVSNPTLSVTPAAESAK